MRKLFLIALFLVTVANAGFLDSVIDTVSSATTTANENQTLIDEVKKQTGLSTTQTTGTLGALLGYAQNNTSSSDYSAITDKVPALSSLTSSPTISPIISSLTSSEMVQSTLKSFGVDPSLIQTIIPIMVNYVSDKGGESSGNILSSAFSGLLQ
jgi:hypothetical protein